ncbi:MAG: GNAT family N-acetyltransferase [Promethearchaeota archaeon]
MKDFNIEKWQKQWKDKEITPADIRNIIKPGNRVAIGSACSEPLLLTKELLMEKEWNFPDVEIMHFFSLSNLPYFSEKYPSIFRHNTLSIIGSPVIRDAINSGKSDFTPITTYEIPKMLHGRRFKIDVALLQLSPPDKSGYFSLGINVGINRAILDSAEIVIAHINPNMPRTLGDSFVSPDQIDYFVYQDYPLLEYEINNLDEIDKRISHNIAKLIENGSTLNIGFGKIPFLSLKALMDLDVKDLAIYSEVIPETIIPLVENGNINCKKNHYPHCVTNFAVGTKKLYNFVDDNPLTQFYDSEFVLDYMNIVKNHKLCSIYGAIAVDLIGQTTNHLKKRFFSGIGGQADFVHATTRAKRGKNIIALRSITKNGESRIVPLLEDSLIVLRSFEVHYVVTEWGIANLYGKPIRERVLQMIGIAHPKFRQELLEKAKQMNLIYKDQEIPTTKDGYVVICPDIEWEIFLTKKNEKIYFRPIEPSDERYLQELYYSLSGKDRVLRFFSPQKVFLHEDTQSQILCDYQSKMIIVGWVGEKEEDRRIIAVGGYEHIPNTNLAEFSVTVHKDYRRLGIAKFILFKTIELAEERGFAGLCGDVFVNNEAMLQILNGIPYDVVFSKDKDETDILHFYFYFRTPGTRTE